MFYHIDIIGYLARVGLYEGFVETGQREAPEYFVLHRAIGRAHGPGHQITAA